MNFACNSVFDGYRTHMATLQVRSFDDRLYAKLRARAKTNHRSVAKEVVAIVEQHMGKPSREHSEGNARQLALAGKWKDSRATEEIIRDIYSARTLSRPVPSMD